MVELLVCDFCETPVLGATVCDSCKLLRKKLDAFYDKYVSQSDWHPLLEAAKLALDNLSSIATLETIYSVVYQETRMKLLLAIEKFEND